MSTVLTKKQMTEEDIKLQYITPAIISKWDVRKITMETQVTDGKINLKGNFVFREKPKRADYILYMSANNPIAVIEAKDNKHSISHGLQQAMTYAQMLDLPFAYSSNGDGFAEHDFLTGKERVIGLDEFPSESELIERFKQESGMTSAQEAIIQQPYYSSQNTYPPRYYQRIAINRTVDAIARGQKRLLLVMAKETKYISNLSYFHDPVYSYSLKEGIEDGFLAPFRVINIMTDIGDGWRPRKGQRDIFGNEIEDRIYTNSDYDYNIIIEDRIQQVALEITRYLKATDRMAKTIVFCATEDAAERMRQALVNLNADMVRKNPDYVVRITGSDDYGKKKLDYFISVASPYPVIATTSKLLSTGADCKMTKLIVLDEMIGSMTEFKQIIGRGTRLREKEGKTHFVVMDFRNVTRLFADPDWDGPIEINEKFTPKKETTYGEESDQTNVIKDPKVPYGNPKPIIDRDGCKVQIIHKTVSVYDTNGKLLRQESIVDYTKENIIGEYASLDNFIRQWSQEEKKEKIKEMLLERGINLETMKKEQNMVDVDDFDFICHVAFDKKPLTRKERANNVKKRDFLSKYSGIARDVLEALLDKYMNTGIYEIEKTEILKLDPFLKLGKPAKIAGYFGGKAGYMQAVKELEKAIYTEEAV